jgi:hypothetical protein
MILHADAALSRSDIIASETTIYAYTSMGGTKQKIDGGSSSSFSV